jgi:hypothetical protein
VWKQLWQGLTRRFRPPDEEKREPTPAEVRKAAVNRYFRPAPPPSEEVRAYLFLRIGGVTALLGVAVFVVGLPAVAVAVLLVSLVLLVQGAERLGRFRREFAAANPKPSDAEMDRYLKADRARVAQHAMRRLGLRDDELELTSEQADPLHLRWLAEHGSGPPTVVGPVLEAKKRIGDDEVWRFSANEMMVICPTADHIGIFECTVDYATGAMRDEEIREFYYADITMVSLVNKPATTLALHPLDWSGQRRALISRVALVEMQVAVSSGDRSTIVAGISPKDGSRRVIKLQESHLEYVVEAVRRLLRVKKRRVVTPAGQ